MPSIKATEEDLEAGLQSIGRLASVGQARALRRESLFAPELSDTPPPSEPKILQRPAKERPRTATRSVERPPAKARARSPTAQRAPASPGDGLQGAEDCSSAPIYTEQVTVPMTAEMRTSASLLAAELQRQRTKRTERFTANTVFRVAISRFLEAFRLEEGDRVNSEAELLALTRSRQEK